MKTLLPTIVFCLLLPTGALAQGAVPIPGSGEAEASGEGPDSGAPSAAAVPEDEADGKGQSAGDAEGPTDESSAQDTAPAPGADAEVSTVAADPRETGEGAGTSAGEDKDSPRSLPQLLVPRSVQLGVSRRARPVSHAVETVPERHPARDPDLTLSLGVSMIWTGDRGYSQLDEPDRRDQVDVAAAYDVFDGAHVSVALGASYRHDSAEGNGLVATAHTVQGELTARFAATEWLLPQLRLAGGVITNTLSGVDDSWESSLNPRDNSGVLTLGAGLLACTRPGLLATPLGRLSSLSVGALFEGGYVWAGPATFTGQRTRIGDVARQGVSLGSLEQGGGYVRVMGVVRF